MAMRDLIEEHKMLQLIYGMFTLLDKVTNNH